MKRKDVPARAQELNRDLVQALEELDKAYRAAMRYIVLNLYERALRKFTLRVDSDDGSMLRPMRKFAETP